MAQYWRYPATKEGTVTQSPMTRAWFCDVQMCNLGLASVRKIVAELLSEKIYTLQPARQWNKDRSEITEPGWKSQEGIRKIPKQTANKWCVPKGDGLLK